MHAASPTFTALDYSRLRIPMAALEVLIYLSIVAAASLAFLAGWLTVNGAVVLTVLLLGSLIVLSWLHLGQGRHPVFLFLCTLTLFQGGRLIAYCLGSEPDPLRIVLMAQSFTISRDLEGITLFCLAASAICVYAPCRWRYHSVAVPDLRPVSRFLPFLYWAYFSTLPIQLWKNYLYLKYVQANGGYLVFFTDYAGLVASVPPIVRALALITYPVYIALFVFETRKGRLWLITVIYFLSAALFLLTGSRMDLFSLILSLWYVSRIKQSKRSRLMVVASVALVLVLTSNAIQAFRFEGSDESLQSVPRLVKFVKEQGISINVTEVTIKFRNIFRPYIGEYLQRDIFSKFISSDVTNYRRGQQLSLDVPLFLNPDLFFQGLGTGGTYLAQGYIFGGVAGVVAFSLLIGLGLRFIHAASAKATTLFLVATILPDIVMLPRGGILVWISTVLRTTLVLGALAVPWIVVGTLSSLGRSWPVDSPSQANG